jgi:hypothetical protein
MNGYSIHENHNAEDARLKNRPMGQSTKTSLFVIAFYHAISMISKQCLDAGFCALPELMIIVQSYPSIR